MTRGLLTVASIAVSLAALIARAIAIGLSDLDRGLRGYRTDPVPDVIPEWVNESLDLP